MNQYEIETKEDRYYSEEIDADGYVTTDSHYIFYLNYRTLAVFNKQYWYKPMLMDSDTYA